MRCVPNCACRLAVALALCVVAGAVVAQPEPGDPSSAIDLYRQAAREMVRQQQMRAPYFQPPTVQRFTLPGAREDAWWMHRWLERAGEPGFAPPHGPPPFLCPPPYYAQPCPGCMPRCW